MYVVRIMIKGKILSDSVSETKKSLDNIAERQSKEEMSKEEEKNNTKKQSGHLELHMKSIGSISVPKFK